MRQLGDPVNSKALRFRINLCKASFNQHSLASPVEHSLLYQDSKKRNKEASKPAAVNMVFIALCAIWLSGLKCVCRLRPKCSDKIGAPECVVLRTLAAVYL